MYVIRKVSATGEGERDNLHQPAIMTALPPASSPCLFLAPELPNSQRIKLAPEQAIFLFVASGTLPPSVSTLQSVYDDHHEDGFLYTRTAENFRVNASRIDTPPRCGVRCELRACAKLRLWERCIVAGELSTHADTRHTQPRACACKGITSTRKVACDLASIYI